jgi:hypothetical protein
MGALEADAPLAQQWDDDLQRLLEAVHLVVARNAEGL